MVTSTNTGDKFTYIWKIKNLCYSTLQTGESITSPKFCVPQFQKTTWYLKMYPKGETEYVKDHISCFLYRGDESGPETIKIKFDIQCNFKKNCFSLSYNFKKTHGYGYKDLPLCEKDNLIDYYSYVSLPLRPEDHCLLIILEIQFLEMHTFNDEKCVENYLSSTLKTNLRLSHEKALEIPIQCLAETKVCYDKKTTQWPIDCLINGPKPVEIIPFVLAEKYPTVVVDLKNDPEYEEYKVIEIRLLDGKVKKSFLVICEISICCKQKSFFLFQEQHTFTAENGVSAWLLEDSIDMEEINNIATDNNTLLKELYLKLDFTFSHGKIYSEIVSIEHVPRNLISSNDSGVSNKILCLYKEKKLCDVVLKVNSSSFDVHKVVLGASSPVFAAMFMNKMLEASSNIVNIVDLDKDTVAEMVEFMYTGSLKELEFERAQKLFIAGDKYQISCLVDLCRDFIIDHIDLKNIFIILCLADLYTDLKLEKEAVKYIKLNKNQILNSTEWEKFEKDNMSLAIRTIKTVCLLSKRNIM